MRTFTNFFVVSIRRIDEDYSKDPYFLEFINRNSLKTRNTPVQDLSVVEPHLTLFQVQFISFVLRRVSIVCLTRFADVGNTLPAPNLEMTVSKIAINPFEYGICFIAA